MAPEPASETHPEDITDTYEIGETLGTGHFSKVKLGIHKETGMKVAIKIIQKPPESKMSMLKAEVDILTKSDHPNIVKLYKVIDTPQVLYLVMELLTGGELFDRIIAKNHYTEEEARKLTVTMLKAILYLHEQGVAHRDLKPENILLKDTSEDAEIKITDFGLSKIFSDDLAGEVVMKTACGTPGYVAPEVLMHDNYSSQVDLWSIGVIVYILLCGFPPFYGDNDNQMFRKIKAGQFKFLAPYWDPISADAKDFVARLLTVDWRKRMTAQEALDHKWLRQMGVSTANLFEGTALLHPTGAGDTHDGSPREVEAPAAAHAAEGAAANGMQGIFADYQVDRKTSDIVDLRRTFALPEDALRLSKFKCALDARPGQLHLTTYHACWLGAGAAKKLTLPYTDMASVAKSKTRFKIFGGSGGGVTITTTDGRVITLAGVVNRDEAIAGIKEAGALQGVTLA